MEHVDIAGVGQPVSQVILGTATRPFMRSRDAAYLIDAALDTGVNTFDLARAYGAAEETFGRWLRGGGRRDRVVLLSKGGHPGLAGQSRVCEKDIRRDLERSLAALGTDFIDIYLMHRDDERRDVGELVELLNTLRAEGKIGAFGGSNWTHERIAAANAYAAEHGLVPLAVSSPQFGLASQERDPWGGGCVSISGPRGTDARAWYRAHDVCVVAYSSLGRGMLSGRVTSDDVASARRVMDRPAYKGFACADNFERLRRCEELARELGCDVPSVAMRWVIGQGLAVCAVVSTTRTEGIRANVAALDLELTEEQLAWLDLR